MRSACLDKGWLGLEVAIDGVVVWVGRRLISGDLDLSRRKPDNRVWIRVGGILGVMLLRRRRITISRHHDRTIMLNGEVLYGMVITPASGVLRSFAKVESSTRCALTKFLYGQLRKYHYA